MSTKIHDGFKINSSSFNDVYELLLNFGAKAQEIGLRLYSTMAYKMAVYYFDRQTLNPSEESKEGFYAKAVIEIMDRTRKIKETGLRDPHVDFECNVVIYPMGSFFLARVVTEKEEYIEAFREFHFVDEYGYWNNTDRPDRLTEKQWKQREEDWEKVFNLRPRLAPSGLVFEAASSFFQPDRGCLTPEVYDVSRRAKNLAQEKLVEEKYDEEKGPGQVFSILTSKENKPRLEELITEVTTKIKPVITQEDLK